MNYLKNLVIGSLVFASIIVVIGLLALVSLGFAAAVLALAILILPLLLVIKLLSGRKIRAKLSKYEAALKDIADVLKGQQDGLKEAADASRAARAKKPE